MTDESTNSENAEDLTESAGSGAVDSVVAEEVVAEEVVQEAVEEVVAGGSEVDADAEDVQEEAEEELSPEDLEFSADEIITGEDEEEDEDENASPIEEYVEPVAEASVNEADMEWFILKVQVNREKSICEALRRQVRINNMQDFFSDILVPTEDVREFTKAGKPKIVKRKLYPGYIVVRMAITDESWFLVRDTSGIGDFAGAAGRPVPLSDDEVSRIISTSRPSEDEEGADESIKTAIPFKVGDRVRVKEGYFQNYEGDVSAVDERNGRIEVMINIFGRPNPVDMDHWHVEKLN